MANNTKFVIIYDHKNPKDELSFDDLKNVLQFLEESDVTTEAFQNMEKKTVFGGVANRLSALTDKPRNTASCWKTLSRRPTRLLTR